MKNKKAIYSTEDSLIEIKLNDSEINELINKLNELKLNKNHLHFYFNNSKHQLLIHHNEDSLK